MSIKYVGECMVPEMPAILTLPAISRSSAPTTDGDIIVIEAPVSMTPAHFTVFAERPETSTPKIGTAGLPAVFL